MPRVDAEDAPHSSFTDHWIRVVSDKSADPPEASDEPLRPYFEQDRGNREGQTYLGMALVIQGRQAGDPQLMAAGVTTIEAGLRGDANWAGASFLQGAAYLDLGRADLAIAPLESAVRIREDARYLDALARAYGADGRPDDDVKSLYERALQASPTRYETRYRYAQHLQRTGRVAAAVAQYQEVLDEYPWHPDAHLMLGTALLSTDREAAEKSLLRAALLDPDLRAALMRAVIVSFDSGHVEIRDFVRSESAGVRSFYGLQAVPVGSESPEPNLRFISDGPVDHVRVFSADGYPLRELVASGNPAPLWNLRDSRGLAVPTGIYLVRLSPGAGPVIRILVINAP